MRRTRPADMVSETSTCSSHLVQITLASDSSRTSLGTSVLPSSAMAMATPLRTWEYSALTQYYRTTVFTQMALLYCTLYEFISNMASRSEFFFLPNQDLHIILSAGINLNELISSWSSSEVANRSFFLQYLFFYSTSICTEEKNRDLQEMSLFEIWRQTSLSQCSIIKKPSWFESEN